MVQIIDEDGEADEPANMAEFKSFKPGERIRINLRSLNSVATPANINASQTVVINSNQIVTDMSGNISFGNARKTWAANDSNYRRDVDQARYYLDGFLIAIRYPDGSIKRGFVAYLPKGNSIEFFFLNGVQFSPND